MPYILIMKKQENGRGFSQSVRKEYLWLVTIVTVVCVLTMNYNLNSITDQRYFTVTEPAPEQPILRFVSPQQNLTPSLQTENKACHFPDLDPWHPSLAAYISNETVRSSCPQTQANLTYVDMQGFLIFNESQFEEFVYWLNVKAEEEEENVTLPFSINCFYWTFDRATGLDDNNVAYSYRRDLKAELSPIALDEDMVEVICYKNTTQEKVYWNIHAHPANKSDRIFSSPTDTQLSVLLLGIDSLSYSMFRRRMPLTNDYIVNKMGMHMFKKMNKVGENSYPNLMTMLTGKRAKTEQDDMVIEMDPYDKSKFDSAPIIWRHFAAKGYATVFNEDWTTYGTFHYYAQGFAKKPVDYYYHMFWLVADRNYKNRYCVANRASGEVHTDITRRHLVALKDTLQFGFHFFTDYSHQSNDDVNMGDEIYAHFFRDMFEQGFFNKTAVFFFGDHGHRFSSIRQTLIGSFEEHNPMFGVWLPEWFYRQHPHLRKVLKTNADRYCSTFDVHETLKDILNEEFDTPVQNPKLKRGLSLLRTLPEKRTCKQAGVPDRYCLCKEENPIDIRNDTVIEAAEYTIKLLNKYLRTELIGKKCQKIELEAILGATSIDYDQNWGRGNDHLNKLKLILLTRPNKAVFEAILGKNSENSTQSYHWTLSGEIERISEYGHSADCIDDKHLRKYCTCKS